jgi:hypothetical protein
MYRTLLFSCALLTIAPAVPGAGDASLDRGTLRGLKSINVIIDKVDPQLSQEGLTAEFLQGKIEARLGSAKISVDKAAKEFLGLRVLAARINKGPYSVCLSLGLYQPVMLSRDKEIRTATQTWEIETILVAPQKVLMQSSEESLNELVDHFAGAWRSVNSQ